jgi:hypothetical protein
MRAAAAAIVSGLIAWSPVDGSSLPPRVLLGEALSIAELAAQSRLVVLGRTMATGSDWNPARTMILTRVDLAIDEVLKGSAPGATLTIHELGGQVGDVASVVAEAASFVPGERVLLFLTSAADGRLHVVGLYQGKFSVERTATGEDVVLRHVPGSRTLLDRLSLGDARRAIATPEGEE